MAFWLLCNGLEIRMDHTALIQSRALLARQQLLHQHQHKRLARRIHDEISQQLTLLSLQLSLALTDSKTQAKWEQQCQQWSSLVLKLGQNLRGIMNELQPRILDEFGLTAALQWFVQSCPKGIELHLLLPAAPAALAPAAANELFALCRDIVNEIFAPNGITEATLAMEQTNEVIRLHLRTDQKNPELVSLASQALDDLSVHERLFCVDGSVEIQQDPAKGLAITLSLPVSRQPVSHEA
jgi:signal transduction histidine kinase